MKNTWAEVYNGPAQALWALLILPAAFLVWLALRGARGDDVEPRAAGFVRAWAALFAAVALVDVVATGPLKWSPLPFVLLGDARVFALVLVVMQPARARRSLMLEAVGWTLVVPAFAYGFLKLVERVATPQAAAMLWVAYEVAFVVLADCFVVWVVPRRVGPGREPVARFVRAVLGFVVLYYSLWALADVLVLNAIDRGWLLRMLPNQLYYGAFVPFAYWRFFSGTAASSSASSQAPA